MKKDLNKLERAIITEIIGFNKKECSFIRAHIPHLTIRSREKTGVGLYIHFGYSEEGQNLEIDNSENFYLSSNKNLKLDVLEYDLNYELNINNGKINFLELVTND